MKIKIILTLFIIVWIGLIVRLFHLSVQFNEYYETLSENNSIKAELTAPVRGEILDRNNEPIAINELGFKISLAPHLTKGDDRTLLDKEIAYLLSMIPTLDADKIAKEYIQKSKKVFIVEGYVDVISCYKNGLKKSNIRELRKLYSE